MDITWLGHSCFRIKGNHATVVTDPYSPDLGYSLGKLSADIVCLSHEHPGHSYFQGISGQPRRLNGPGEYEIGGVLIIGTSTFHDQERGSQRGRNTVYTMEIDELNVCHLGDLGHVLTAAQVEELGGVDVLLLPVGGLSTIDAPMAAAVVRQLEPKIVVPMHYKTPALNRELEPVERFLTEVGVNEAKGEPKLTVKRSTLPDTTQVVLLSY
jgi:L-ascorbate metabolism protein UlaG (beta-lactamase superfamily)